MENWNRRNNHNDLLQCSGPSLTDASFWKTELQSALQQIGWTRTNDTQITNRRNSLLRQPTMCYPVKQSQGDFCMMQRWSRHHYIMMLFRIVSGLWDEVTPHYVNWVVVLQGNHRKDLNLHPQKGHEHSIRPARYGTKHISPTALAWVTGAGFEPANSGLWAQNDTASPPRAKNRSNNRTTDRSLANIASD